MIAKKLQSSQFLRFLVAGGLAAAVNFLSRFLYSLFCDFEVAVTLAFFTGLSTGFVLSKNCVFTESKNNVNTQAGLFALVNLVALAQTWLISVYLSKYLLNDRLGMELGQTAAHFLGVVFPVGTSYFGHKFLTFRK